MSVLVTGATGRHGGTGAYVVRRLREHGIPVRALVRRRDERSERVAELGAEIVVGDLHDYRSLVPALEGVSATYFAYPVDTGILPAASHYAEAVREVGGALRTVVMSMGPATQRHPSHLGRSQWLAEQILQWAGLDLTIVRVAAVFHENLPILSGRSVRAEGVIRSCFGTGPVGWINALDAAELCVTALLRPERFAGAVAHYVPGTELFDHNGVAKILGGILDRTVEFEPVSREAWQQELTELAATPDAGMMNPDMARHISACGHAVAEGLERQHFNPTDTEAFRRITGRAPISLHSYLAATADLYR